MKITLNCNWGGWILPDEIEEQYNYMDTFSDPNIRYNADIIQWLEDNPDCKTDLKVFEIPEASTDHKIINYDGQEDCLYVLDGKLHWLRGYFNY